ncbi:DNA repair protein [Xylaria digitata]|nr:DNA repair protein [Xylaria digitata]
MAFLNPQITNLIIILGMMQVSKKVPFDDPTVLNGVRALYIGSNVLIAAIYGYVLLQINKKKDLTTLKYVEPAPMGSSEEGKLITTTVQAYDAQQIKANFRSQLMGLAMMGFMHLYMKYTNPLLIQSIIPFKSAIEANLVQIHLFGKPASGDLKRPFKQPAGFMSGLQSGPAQSDKKAVEAAERAGRGIMERPSTPSRAATGPSGNTSTTAVSPLTPEVTRRIEENRLKAKAIRDQKEAAARAVGAPTQTRTPSGFIATDQVHIPNTRKRAHDSISSSSTIARTARDVPSTSRDGRVNGAPPTKDGGTQQQKDGAGEKDGAIRPARKFAKFVDYDLGKMTDTKGGFLSAEDDPWNKAMSGSSGGAVGSDKKGPEEEQRPKGMTVQEWERLQLLKRLRRQKAGPFEPGLSTLTDEKARKKCRECGTLEIDFVWDEVFGCAVCNACKEAHPEKYSLLTKTECRDDYLLTDPELRDEELLPHLSRPNPHKSHWHDMMLFLRYQVEEYVFSAKKWGSASALDAEFERREAEKKKRKEAKFKEKLLDLKKRTRTDAYLRGKGRFDSNGSSSGGGGGAKKARFGDTVADGGKHVHEWGRVIENEDGATVKTCTTCGMEVEELEF